jgi:hypothetical protein
MVKSITEIENYKVPRRFYSLRWRKIIVTVYTPYTMGLYLYVARKKQIPAIKQTT